MSIIEKLWKIRESKKISRKEMASFLCISPDTYKDIEYEKIRLTLENFLSICNKLEISPMELLKNNENENFILLNHKDIEDLNRILNKINNQTNYKNTFNNNTFNGDVIIGIQNKK